MTSFASICKSVPAFLTAYIRGWQTFPEKGQIVHIDVLDCIAQLVSTATTQLCYCSSKIAIAGQGAWLCSSKTYLSVLKLNFMLFSHVIKHYNSLDFFQAFRDVKTILNLQAAGKPVVGGVWPTGLSVVHPWLIFCLSLNSLLNQLLTPYLLPH